MSEKKKWFAIDNYETTAPVVDKYGFGDIKKPPPFAIVVELDGELPRTLRSKLNQERYVWEDKTKKKFSVHYGEYEGRKVFFLSLKVAKK